MRSIASSSAQAEYMSMAMATREGIWLRRLLSDLGYGDLSCATYGRRLDEKYRGVRMKDEDPHKGAYVLAGDNKAALQMARNPVHHKKGKHIHLAWNLTREEVKKGSVAPAHIPTDHNPADLMTKSLKKTLHRRHAGTMLTELGEGGLLELDGSPSRTHVASVVRDTLYKTEPPGLGKASDMIDKLDRVCTTDFETGFYGLSKQDFEARARRLETCKAGVGLSGEQSGGTEIAAAADLVVDICAYFCELLIEELNDAILNGLSAIERDEMINALQTAILDSGASQTYVTKGVKLSNAKPGKGSVKVANGRMERIVEKGDLGPLSGARKVNSFSRTLVSVVDTAEQVGDVLFTPKDAWVVNVVGDKTIKTKIATRTRSRLYSFDIQALERHIDKLREVKGGTRWSTLNALDCLNMKKLQGGRSR